MTSFKDLLWTDDDEARRDEIVRFHCLVNDSKPGEIVAIPMSEEAGATYVRAREIDIAIIVHAALAPTVEDEMNLCYDGFVIFFEKLLTSDGNVETGLRSPKLSRDALAKLDEIEQARCLSELFYSDRSEWVSSWGEVIHLPEE